MIKGKALNYNSTLGIVCPSSPEDKNIMRDKINEFISLGFKVKLGDHIFDQYGYLAGYDLDRGGDINQMFLDPEVDGIICFRGGYGSIRTIPYINSSIIKNNPKFFCGYSDITTLLNYFSRLGLITFHGPMINSNFKDKETLNSFKSISSCKYSNYSYDLNSLGNITYINKGSFSGKLVGGNLSTICSSLGTPYEIDTTDSILLLEDINEVPYSIDRMLTHLINNHKFEKCNGIILGTFTDCTLNNYSKSLTLDQLILDILYPLNIPIIKSFPIGHSYPNLTIPIGVNATFSHTTNKLTILENFLT